MIERVNKIIENLLLFMYKAIPLQKKVVFRSFNGHYSDSPKAISEALHVERPDVKIVWLVDKSRMVCLPDYVTGAALDSREALYHLNTAAAFVDNNYGRKGIVITRAHRRVAIARALAWLNSRKGQFNLTTWHGTPLKRLGNDQFNDGAVDLVTPPLTMIHPDRHTREVLDRLTFHRASHEILGLPRNDVLFYPEKRDEIRQRLGLPLGKRIVLYAPTFRSDGFDTDNRNLQRSGLSQLNQMDFDKLFAALGERFGGADWAFVGRFHYYVEQEIDWDALERKYPGRIINGNRYDDMSDYLAASDVLITDSSSCMFDFALTGRPVFLFFPDLEHYQGVERGFYFDIESLPFMCAKTFDDLLPLIRRFDNERYRCAVKQMQTRLGTISDGLASKRAVELIVTRAEALRRA